MRTIKSNISTLEIEGTSAVITIDNGTKNLLTVPEFIDMTVLTQALENNPQVTSLIIRGAGRHFSHGADVKQFEEESIEGLVKDKLLRGKKLLKYIENLPLVTVAAVNGGCFGGGLEVALSCQFIVCAKNSYLGLTEINHGIIPGLNGIERLSKKLGRSKAISMILSADILSASDALKIGLVDIVSENKDCMEDAVNFCRQLTDGKTPSQVRAVVSAANLAVSESEINIENDDFEDILAEKRQKSILLSAS